MNSLVQKNAKSTIEVLFILVLCLAIFFIADTIASSSTSYNSTSLVIWDDSDTDDRYTECTNYCVQKIKSVNLWEVYFYANYTDLSNEPLNSSNGNGNCTIRFNETGSWGNWLPMLYNSSFFLWQENNSFSYKGNLSFEINCTSYYGNITLSEQFSVTNTIPYIIKTAAGYIDFDGDGVKDTLYCYEDALCYYNFSANVSEDDNNDVLLFNYSSTTNTTLTNFTLNPTSGMLIINITKDENAGQKKIELSVKDTESPTTSGILDVNITIVNDPPVFIGLTNRSFNMTQLFENIVTITDEENNVPFVLNISFINCSLAFWSTRGNNCTLFTNDQYSFNQTSGILNLSFTPIRNDVGSYIINFSVMDNSSRGNQTGSKIINFTVVNINSAPYFNYICDNERNATEDSEFICWINVTDIDEMNNLTVFANFSWFKFNNSGSNNITLPCNSSTLFNASALVNFTPTDSEVGNWSINITVIDIGLGVLAPKSNSTLIRFFINNTEDVVTLEEISNISIYEDKTIYINATDDDLLVKDSSIKDENLIFASNTSWVSVSPHLVYLQNTTAKVDIDYDYAFTNFGQGNYTVKINVTDSSGNYAERDFTISLVGDNIPVWNSSILNRFIFYEDSSINMNLSQNVTDIDGDDINFSYSNNSAFPSFSLNADSGLIIFTPTDLDVGYHNVTINASDGKLASAKSFNFTIYNVNDNPLIFRPLQQSDMLNVTVDALSNINCTEDAYTFISFWVYDEDFKITQKSYYNESLSANLSISGRNQTLFSFVKNLAFPTPGNNISKFEANFTPRKSDVGSYNITINITDISGGSSFISFNLTVLSIEHNPVLMDLSPQNSSINKTLYYRINATDLEGGNSTQTDNFNFTFDYDMLGGLDIFNSTTFNATTGIINITFIDGQGGRYHINISVNDTSERQDFKDFWIYVYDTPNIVSPIESLEFNFSENLTANLTINVNHSIGDSLSYWFYTENVLRDNFTSYGNGTNLTWDFVFNYSDETYGLKRNLTLVVFSPLFPDINSSRSWGTFVNHSNAPVVFSGHIGDQQADYKHDILIDLTNYFLDVDYFDEHYNQTLIFNVSSNATPSYIRWSVNGAILNLSALIVVKEIINITARDLNNNGSIQTNASSNDFEVDFTEPSAISTPSPSSSGGSGTVPVAFKIISPEKVSAYAYQKIIVPLKLFNNGRRAFSYINVSTYAFKDGNIAEKVETSLSKSYFEHLEPDKTEFFNLTIFFKTNATGDYEVVINASSKSPVYEDWAKIYISLQKVNETDLNRLLVFTEELIAENPECLELKEILDNAKKYSMEGDLEKAKLTAERAVTACRDAIAEVSLPTMKLKEPFTMNEYSIIAILVSVFLGFSYYSLKRSWFKKRIYPDNQEET